MVPGLLRQAAGQLEELSAEEVDGALTVLARWLLAARSVSVVDVEPEVPSPALLEAPAHNLD